MSFILDALKKSETDRQQRGTAEFANVPSSSGRREGPPAWLWVVALLLLVNLVVLIGIMLRPDVSIGETDARQVLEPVTQQVTESAALETDEPPASVIDDFADQVASARQNAPPAPPVLHVAGRSDVPTQPGLQNRR